jgi:hypothetical protein
VLVKENEMIERDYEVYFYYEVRGKAIVGASSKEDAEAKFQKIMEEEGIDDEAMYEMTDRDYGTTGAELTHDELVRSHLR